MAGAEHFDVVATVFDSTLRLLSIESYPDSTINLSIHATPPLRDNVGKASHHQKTVVYSRRLAPSTTLCCSTSVSVPEAPKVCGKHPIINVGPRFDGVGETRPLSACLAQFQAWRRWRRQRLNNWLLPHPHLRCKHGDSRSGRYNPSFLVFRLLLLLLLLTLVLGRRDLVVNRIPHDRWKMKIGVQFGKCHAGSIDDFRTSIWFARVVL